MRRQQKIMNKLRLKKIVDVCEKSNEHIRNKLELNDPYRNMMVKLCEGIIMIAEGAMDGDLLAEEVRKTEVDTKSDSE